MKISDSQLQIDSTDDGRTIITLSPLGFAGTAKNALYVGGCITFVVSLAIASMTWMLLYGYGGIENYQWLVMFASVFGILGLLILLAGMQLVKKTSHIVIDPQRLTVTQHGPLWKSEKSWARADIESVDVQDDYDSESRSHSCRLRIRIKQKRVGVKLFYERNEDEIHRLAWELQQVLGR